MNTHRFIKQVALCASCIIALLATPHVNAMTLHEAMAVAYKNNPELKAERAALKAIDESMPQALSGFLPNVSISYSRGQNKTRLNGTGSDTFTSDVRSLNVNQPIFDGGSTVAAVNAASARIDAGRETLRNAVQNLLNNSVATYMDVLRTREVVKLSAHNENVLTEQLDATRQRFELGESTRTDVSQAESRLARATSDRITAEAEAVTAAANFKRIHLVEAPKLITMPKNLPPVPESYEEGLAQSLAGQPELQSLLHSYQAAGYNVHQQQGELLPEVDLVGRITRSENPSQFTQQSDDESVTLDVVVPLFQGGGEYSAIREAKRSKEQIAYQIDNARNIITQNFTDAWQQIITTKANIDASNANVTAAEIALDGVRKENEFGSRTILDILDAEQELFDAKVNLVTAERNHVVAVYNLLRSTGELSAEKLSLNTPIYDPQSHYRKVRNKVIGF